MKSAEEEVTGVKDADLQLINIYGGVRKWGEVTCFSTFFKHGIEDRQN
jgi:hypothetical protein